MRTIPLRRTEALGVTQDGFQRAKNQIGIRERERERERESEYYKLEQMSLI